MTTLSGIDDGNYWLKFKNSKRPVCQESFDCFEYVGGKQIGEAFNVDYGMCLDGVKLCQCKVLCKKDSVTQPPSNPGGKQPKRSPIEEKAFTRQCKLNSGKKKRQTDQYAGIILDMFLNPEKISKTEELRVHFSNLTKQFFDSAEMAIAYPNLFKLLWYSNIPCFKNSITDAFLLKKCIWQGVEYNCTDLFKQVPTDSGYCEKFIIFIKHNILFLMQECVVHLMLSLPSRKLHIQI